MWNVHCTIFTFPTPNLSAPEEVNYSNTQPICRGLMNLPFTRHPYRTSKETNVYSIITLNLKLSSEIVIDFSENKWAHELKIHIFTQLYILIITCTFSKIERNMNLVKYFKHPLLPQKCFIYLHVIYHSGHSTKNVYSLLL